MDPKSAARHDQGASGKAPGADPYDLDTPRWQQFYRRVRKTIRFPRYYKKDLNW